jgi:hypothetical protein
MSKHKKLLHISFIFAFINMMMCPVVHALHDQYIGHEVVNFPLHSSVQKQSPGDSKHYQEDMLCSPFAGDIIKSSFLQNTPFVLLSNPSNKVSIISTVRLNL